MNTLHTSKTTAMIMLSAVFATSAPRPSTVVRVEDASGAPLADAVVLVNPGEQYRSLALVTNRGGEATVSDLDCKPCVVTAMDPRHLFASKTTEFESGTPVVSLLLSVRPIIDRVRNLSAVKVTLKITGIGGTPLRDAEIVLRDGLMTMDDNNFMMLKSNQKGLVTAELSPGEYVIATRVAGRFLEATFQINPAARRHCSEEMTKCLISSARRTPPGMLIAVHFSERENSPK